MAKLCLKKNSKRVPARRRYKIEKRVREHNRKLKKLSKKEPKGYKSKLVKIPQQCPFRDEILQEAEKYKQQKQEEIERLKALKKEEKEREKAGGLEGLVSKAEDAQKLHDTFTPEQDENLCFIKKDGSLKAYCREFKKVVEAADVVLEVVDARDPMGTRCKQVEEAVMKYGQRKRLVIVINKADLVPRENLDQWLKYLRGSFPAVPFKSSTQSQTKNLGRKKMKKSKKSRKLSRPETEVSSSVGAEFLMSILANYCRNKGIKTSITVGVVGLPNVGKSSVINSLKRSKACNVGAVPGVTKAMQEIQLDSKIKLLDSPGLVFTQAKADDPISALRNAVKVDTIVDPMTPATAILQRVTTDTLMEQYDIGNFETPEEFFSLKAKREGKYKKGGVLDRDAAARSLIDDWNRGKIRYYTVPPEAPSSEVSSTIVKEMAAEFNLENNSAMEVELMEHLKSDSKTPMFEVKPSQQGMSESTMDVDKHLEPNVVVQSKKKKKGSMFSSSKKVVEPLVPTGMKKLQKVQAKKMRKMSARRVKQTSNLADDLQKFSFGTSI